MQFDLRLDGHTFLLKTSAGTWMAKSQITADQQTLVVEFYIPDDEDEDFLAWHARVMDLIIEAVPDEMCIHEICHVGTDETNEHID